MEMVDIVVISIISGVKMTKATPGIAISDIGRVVECDAGFVKFRTLDTMEESVVCSLGPQRFLYNCLN